MLQQVYENDCLNYKNVMSGTSVSNPEEFSPKTISNPEDFLHVNTQDIWKSFSIHPLTWKGRFSFSFTKLKLMIY